MVEVNIFVVSSRRAEREAAALATALNAAGGKVKLNPVLWWQTRGYSYILENIIEQTDECDFAAILLTGDDVLLKKDTADAVLKARDNCIFEAGLFTGALGPDPQRCFLLVSVNPRELPSDLAGIKYIDILEFNGANDDNKVLNKFSEAARKISQAIDANAKSLRATRGLKLPLISQDELLRLEQLAPAGNLHSDSSNVFISSAQPLELDPTFARRTMTNMVNGRSDYLYVLEAHARGTRVLSNVIGRLVGVDQLDDRCVRTPDENFQTIFERLRIHFLPDLPGLHYCIHNADLYEHAICYLRSPIKSNDGKIQFVEWCKGKEAVTVASEITRMCEKPPEDNKRVLNSTKYYDLDGQETIKFRTGLFRDIVARLPTLEKAKVNEFFFGSQISVV